MSDRRTDFIYEQLNTLKLGGDSSSTDIQRLQDQVNIQAVNIEAMKTYNLINEASMRNGNPMPYGANIVQTTGDSPRVQFTPAIGQVFSLVGADMLATGGTTASGTLQLRDAAGQIVLIGQFGSTTGQDLTGDVQYPVIITNDLFLYFNLTAGEARMSTAFVQIR